MTSLGKEILMAVLMGIILFSFLIFVGYKLGFFNAKYCDFLEERHLEVDGQHYCCEVKEVPTQVNGGYTFERKRICRKVIGE